MNLKRAADRAWMYRQPQVWDMFLNRVNDFLTQAEVDMRSQGVPTMYCPYFDCLNQKKFGQQNNIFPSFDHMWIHKELHVLEQAW